MKQGVHPGVSTDSKKNNRHGPACVETCGDGDDGAHVRTRKCNKRTRIRSGFPW